MFSIHLAFKVTGPFCSSIHSELTMDALPSVNPNAVFAFGLRSEDRRRYSSPFGAMQ